MLFVRFGHDSFAFCARIVAFETELAFMAITNIRVSIVMP